MKGENTVSSGVITALPERNYFVKDHLGNTRVTIDENANVLNYANYYAFGAPMGERTFNGTDARFGFNGQQKSDEINGAGNHNTALFWEYDTRYGRRWNLDPKPNVSESRYSTFNNNPIFNADMLGDSIWVNETSRREGNNIIITREINLQGKIYDLSMASVNLEKYKQGLSEELQRTITGTDAISVPNADGTRTIYKYTSKVDLKIVSSVGEIKPSDHVFALVDETLSSKPSTVGIAGIGGKVAYIKNGFFTSMRSLISTSVHETGHLMGLLHTWEDDIDNNDKDPNNYMSYNRNKYPNFSIEQIKALILLSPDLILIVLELLQIIHQEKELL